MQLSAEPTFTLKRNDLIAAVGLALVLLFPLAQIPRANAAAIMPWKAELAAGLFLTVTIAIAIFSKRRWSLPRFSTIYFLIGAFCIWSGISVLWATSVHWTMHHTFVWLSYLVFLWLFLDWNKDRRYQRIIAALGLVAVVLTLMMVLDLTTQPNFTEFSGGVYRIRYGKFGEMLATISPILFAAALLAQKRDHLISAVSIWLISWIGVMLSLSRGAFLAGITAYVVAFGACMAFAGRPRRLRAVILVAAWLVTTFAVQFGISSIGSAPSTGDLLDRNAGKSQTTTAFRVFAWSIGKRMAADHWLLGVGADNFGISVNEARAKLAAARTEDRSPEFAEDYLVERAHNEPLQILAELGWIGILILGATAVVVVFQLARNLRGRSLRRSPMFWAAVAGLIGFVASSMVSSFSFRAIQNGIVFFSILAVLLREIAIHREGKKDPELAFRSSTYFAFVCGLGLLVFAGSKAFAEYTIYAAERTPDDAAPSRLYERASHIDPTNINGHLEHAARIGPADPDAAAIAIRNAIDGGLGVSLTYSRLAEYHLRANDVNGARQAFDESLSIFPNSVFLRIRYARFLETIGENALAAEQRAIAAAIDPRQARGWDALLSRGSVAAFYLAQADHDVAAPAELLPVNAVAEYIDKVNW